MVRIALHPVYASETTNMVSSEYTKLKDLITLQVGMSEMHSQIIQVMKSLYQNDINSIRRFEKISTIGQLLKILEIRDLLSEEKILPLKVLAERLPNNNDLIKNIEDYEKSLMRSPHSNQYVAEQAQHVTQPKNNPPPSNFGKYSSFMDGISDIRRDRMIETVTDEIGSHWRNLARYLGIQECKIDEIQCNYKTLSEKAIKIMEINLKNADRKTWFFDLMDALEKAHRRELSDKLKKIATMNI